MSQDEYIALLREQNARLIDIIALMTRQTGAMETMSASLAKSFPNGDLDGHRRYHEALIQRELRREEIRTAVLSKTISGVIWFLLCGCAVGAFQYAKDRLAQAPAPIFQQPAIERRMP